MNRDELIDFVKKNSGSAYETSKECHPVFFAVGPDDSCAVLMTPWGDEREKVAILGRLREFFRDHDIRRYGHLSEVWTRSFSPEEMRDRNDRMVSSYDDREEKLFMLVVDEDEGVWAATRDIQRSSSGEISLGEIVVLPPDMFMERLTELLPEKEGTWNKRRVH